MTDREDEIRKTFEGMLRKASSILHSDRDFQKNLEDFSARVQWEVGPYKGYQVFDNGGVDGFKQMIDRIESFVDVS